jgi:hypothetical protein
MHTAFPGISVHVCYSNNNVLKLHLQFALLLARQHCLDYDTLKLIVYRMYDIAYISTLRLLQYIHYIILYNIILYESNTAYNSIIYVTSYTIINAIYSFTYFKKFLATVSSVHVICDTIRRI